MSNIKQEGKIIDNFIKQHPTGYFSRNIKVGKSLIPPGKKRYLIGSENTWKIAGKEIDIIWDNNGITWLLEAKFIMDAKALGQLLCYRELYMADNQIEPDKLKLGLICRYIDDMFVDIFDKYHITVFTV